VRAGQQGVVSDMILPNGSSDWRSRAGEPLPPGRRDQERTTAVGSDAALSVTFVGHQGSWC